MILNIEQKDFGQEPLFEIKNAKTNEKIAKCTSMNRVQTTIRFTDGEEYSISFEPVLMEKENDKNKMLYVISENGRAVGGIEQAEVQQKKILFVSVGYDYFQIHFHDSEYELYEIGLGENQHYLCIRQGETTVAIVHKPMEVKSHLDTYVVYLEYESYKEIACIAALFIDGLEYSSDDEIAGSRIKEEYLSFNKELKEKFDLEFLERVKNQ